MLDTEFYLPRPSELAAQSTGNRQGRGETLGPDRAAHVLGLLRGDAARAFGHYREMLNEDESGAAIDAAGVGLARELARIGLPLSTYTQWYWKTDLHNLLHFLALRADAHAQWEIREYARVIFDVVKRWVPLTAGAFERHRTGGIRPERRGTRGRAASAGRRGDRSRRVGDVAARVARAAGRVGHRRGGGSPRLSAGLTCARGAPTIAPNRIAQRSGGVGAVPTERPSGDPKHLTWVIPAEGERDRQTP